MPERSLFFNSTATDRRKYNSVDWAKFMQIFYSTGIISGGDSLRVIAVEDALAVTVTPGCAIIQGRAYFLEEEPLRLAVPSADPAYARLDRVVLRLDLTADVRAINLKVLTGVPSAVPLPPELVRNENIYDLSLAQIRVAPGALAIDALTDERYDAEFCGICKGLYSEDLSDFFDLQNLWDEVNTKAPADTVAYLGEGSVTGTVLQDADTLGGQPKSYYEGLVSGHNAAADAHADIQAELAELQKGFAEKVSGQNLLDNWYFADPINQRGQTEYTITSQQYAIDRWKFAHGEGIDTIVISISEEGLSFPLGAIISQYLDITSYIEGKTVTLSVLYNKSLATATFVWNRTAPYTILTIDAGGIRLAFNGAANYIQIYHYHTDTIYTLKAAKLELGTRQTLAHSDENGNWVLNDPPPNKALEQLKCQQEMPATATPPQKLVLPLASGLTDVGGEISKNQFGEVLVDLAVTGTIGAEAVVATLPEGYRPQVNKHMTVTAITQGGMSMGMGYCIIEAASGNIINKNGAVDGLIGFRAFVAS